MKDKNLSFLVYKEALLLKTTTFQRLISFLLTERTVRSYGKLVNKEFHLVDSPCGQTGWCDFIRDNE